MRFVKGDHYPHPPRGLGRGRYHVSEEARRARRKNLSKSRLRSDRETGVIKLLIWQAQFAGGPHLSQRTLARQLGVWPSYVCKVQKRAAEGLEALVSGQRATLDELADARRFSAKLRKVEPSLLAPATRSQSEAIPSVQVVSEWRPVVEPAHYDPYAHARGCPCRACYVKTTLEAALARARKIEETP